MASIVRRAFYLCAILLTVSVQTSSAGEYPSKAIHIVVALSAGSTSDLRARQIAKPLADRLGVPVVIENKPGASGTIGNAAVASAKADGYRLLLVSNSGLCIVPHLLRELPYDSARAFAPITQIAFGSAVLAVPGDSAAVSIKDLVAAAKAKPGGLTYGSSGIGSPQHLAAELFAKQAGVTFLHIPYKGDADTLLDLTTGRISMSFAAFTAAMPHIKSGKLKALAVTTRKRLALIPDIPTVAETGYPEYEWHNWFGFVAPAGTPATIIERLRKEITAVFDDAALRTEYRNAGYELVNGSPAEFGDLIKNEHQRYGELIRAIGLKPE